MLSSEQLSQLWQQHAAALLLVARGHCSRFGATVAEDCVQEAFVRLATQELQPHEPADWLMRTVRNAAIDVVRSQQRRRSREEKSVENRPAWLEPVDPSTFDTPSAHELAASLEKLDAVTRDIIIGHVWNNLTFRQIADAMDLSTATAHRRYDAGLEHLKMMMSSDSNTAATHIQAIPMNPSDLDFEQRLKQLQPAGCESLASDTFYQAGWNAALQSMKPQKRQPTTTRRHTTSFAAGLLCGLIVVGGAWQFSSLHPTPTNAGNMLTKTKAPEAADIGLAELTMNHRSQPTATADPESSTTPDRFDEYSLLATLADLDQVDVGRFESRALSPVARRSWSKLLYAKPRVSGPETLNTSNAASSLRSFPATREILESLL